MILYTNKQPPPIELRMRNASPRPADEAEETGLGASVFRFSKHETPRRKHWSVSRNETPAKIVFRFCCFITDVFQLWPYLSLSVSKYEFSNVLQYRSTDTPYFYQGNLASFAFMGST